MISIYSDGASGSRGGKPGGWAFVIVVNEDVLGTFYGGSPSTSNNIMEMTGAISGLASLIRQIESGFSVRGHVIELVCDSQYVLGMASGGWAPSKNMELVTLLKDKVAQLEKLTSKKLQYRWVPGHAVKEDGQPKYPWNYWCDRLATKGKIENSPPEVQAKAAKRKKRAA